MVLGITGGIASGKSSVARAFKELGAAVVSADQLARDVVRPGGAVLRKIAEHFGEQVLHEDGSLNRQAMAEAIFHNEEARQVLNGITHPAIAALACQKLREAEQGGAALVIYDAPLLFEAGADRQVDKVLVVAIDEAVQLQRLMVRDGIDRRQALARIASQMPQAEKVARADYVVDNSGAPQETQRQVRALMKRLGRAAGESRVPDSDG